MENIKTFESFIQDVVRTVNPKRLQNDNKFLELEKEIREDFIENNNDLRKVSIIDNGGNKIDWHEIEFGKSYSLTYIFGKYHPIYNNIFTGNERHGNKKVKIYLSNFTITLNKNSIEKAFNTSRINTRKARIEIESISKLDGKINRKEDSYKVSYDVVEPLINDFLEEYNEKYPDLKDSDYKQPMNTDKIKKGIPPSMKWLNFKNKYGEEILWDLQKGENEKEIRKKLYNMKKSEIDQISKNRNKDIYNKLDAKYKDEKEEFARKLLNILNKHKININTKYAKYTPLEAGIEIKGGLDTPWVEFSSKDLNIKSKMEDLIKDITNEFKEYNIENWRVSDGYRISGLKFILISFEKKEF
jgi:hypothetical protein